MIRRPNLLLAAVALPAVVATVIVLAPDGASDRVARTTAGTGIGSAATAPARSDATMSALFIGDSYTKSSRLVELSYACRAAVQMRWACDVSAVPGTGYVSGGAANRFPLAGEPGSSTSIPERIPTLAMEYTPDVVVLDGGRNDLFPPAEDVGKSMASALGEARRHWPDATLVFLRPRYLVNPSDDLGFDDEFMARLKADPAAAGVVFLDPIADSFAGTDTSALLGPDGRHPNALGEQRLADALVTALRRGGIGASS
ncbi:SGNH/GDSL hydrolase family protein [Rhodococcus sp. NPDC003318]|uniref:SGNH/GDSL hydrolase family protein n=1 Tax=Rhodococcus sp. NPDC003318 TaxID=3364503 RepID=UPI00368D1103